MEVWVPASIDQIEVIATEEQVFLMVLEALTSDRVEEAMDVYGGHLLDESLPYNQRRAVLAAFNVVFQRAD